MFERLKRTANGGPAPTTSADPSALEQPPGQLRAGPRPHPAGLARPVSPMTPAQIGAPPRRLTEVEAAIEDHRGRGRERSRRRRALHADAPRGVAAKARSSSARHPALAGRVRCPQRTRTSLAPIDGARCTTYPHASSQEPS